MTASVLLWIFGMLLPSATALALAGPQQLVPVCCRAHGAHSCMMGDAGVTANAGPTLRQPACPFRPGIRALTTARVVADLAGSANAGLVVSDMHLQVIADSVATSVLRRSAPRGPPSSFLL
jgi:hypothetical protein